MTQPNDLRQQFFEMLLDSQFWTPETLRDYQRGQIEQLVRHARKHAPFYETRLDPLFRPDGSIDWAQWPRLPIVRRADMVTHRAAMQAKVLPPGHGPAGVIATSGSTGLPIQITVSALTGIANSGFRWRVHQWQGLDWSEVLFSRLEDGEHRLRFPEGQKLGYWGPPWVEDSLDGSYWRISREVPTAPMLAAFRRAGARYLNAGPNMAHINALDARRLGIDIRIDAILVQGNVVRQADRDACLDIFGARMIEHYSSKEGGQMAHPCPAGNLHINGEGCLVEILDEAGHPCRPGETGRVIITPFFQTAQPLIRYEQGDWATVGKPCSCGRHGPTIAAIRGRAIAIFRHPDGTSVANLMPDETTELLASSYWQLAQTGANEYELRYVPVDAAVPGDEASVRALFHQTFFADASLSFVRREEISLTSGGKLVEYLNEWGPSAG